MVFRVWPEWKKQQNTLPIHKEQKTDIFTV